MPKPQISYQWEPVGSQIPEGYEEALEGYTDEQKRILLEDYNKSVSFNEENQIHELGPDDDQGYEENFYPPPKTEIPDVPIISAEEGVTVKKLGHVLIVGKTHTGKSRLAKKWIKTNRKYFHDFKVLCPTADTPENKEVYNFLHPDKIILEPSDEILKEIVEEKMLNPKKRLLLILDDCIGTLSLKGKTFNLIATRGRQHGLFLLILTQHLNNVMGPILREAANTIYATLPTDTAIPTLFKMVCGFKKENEFREFIKKNCKNYNIIKFDLESGYEAPNSMFKIDLKNEKPFYIKTKT
jgi:hypothetical protein